MDNELIRWQMRKYGYDMHGKKDGIAFADKQFQFLEWLQELYDCHCLTGKFYTNNIAKEIWDDVRRLSSDPLQEMEDGYNAMYDQFMITISGDNFNCHGT